MIANSLKQSLPLFLAFLAVLFVPAQAGAVDFANPGAMRLVRDATVMVSVETGEGADFEINRGSGMIIAPGLAVTNAHVVSERVPTRIYIQNGVLPPTPVRVIARRYDANEFVNADVVEYITRTLLGNTNFENVRLSRQQTNFDIAVLAFNQPANLFLPSLAFNRSAAAGFPVIASGFPGNNGNYSPIQGTSAPPSFSGGFVTGIINKEPQIITHNAQCSTGNSGGPLVTPMGEIVGMQTWTSIPGNPGRYMSLAIGSRDIVDFLERNDIRPMVAGHAPPPPHNPGAPDARPEVLSRADAGDPDANALAGLLHFLGDCGFTKNDEAAVQLLQRAVDSGTHSPNAYLYKAGLAAVLLQSGRLWSPEQALALLRSANSPDPNAASAGRKQPDHRLLAYESALLLQGKPCGIAPDPDRSLTLALQAMEGGFALPYALAGYHYYFGDAQTGKDHAKALRYARESAANNIPEGISLLAHLHYDSDVIEKNVANFQTARRLAEEAASLGDPWAYGLLANIYYDTGAPERKKEALKLALLGTCYGNRLALQCLGRMAWDYFLANPTDLSQAARAWAYTDLAERQGVRTARPYKSTNTRPATTSGSILQYFPPPTRQHVLTEGQREQSTLASANQRPPNPRISRLAGARLTP